MLSDLRFALRTLRRSPMFAAIALASLALGIGANTAIFSLLDQVLLRMLPVRDPERLVVLHSSGRELSGSSTSDSKESVFSYPMYRDIRGRQPVFSGLVARASAPAAIMYQNQTERGRAEIVSGNYFEVLGVRPALGRLIEAADDRDIGGHPVVVLGHGYWARRFGASPAMLNQTVRINGHPMTVIGVAPPQFNSLIGGQAPDLFIPIAMKREVTPTWDGLDDRTVMWLTLFGRLKPALTARGAETSLAAVYRPILEEEFQLVGGTRRVRYPDRYLAQRIELRAASQGVNALAAMWKQPLIALAAMAGLVLLITCANVAGLMMARAAARGREIAVRSALGAGRLRLIRQLLIESFVLGLAGGAAGLVAAAWAIETLLRVLNAADVLSAQIDTRLLLFNFAMSLAAGLLFGLAPAFRAVRTEIATTLKDESASVSAHGRWREVMVAGQIALALVLLVSAGLFARTLSNLRGIDAGFHIDRLYTFAVDPRLSGYGRDRGFEFYRVLRERLAALPGSISAGAANITPLDNNHRGGNLTVEGWRGNPDQTRSSLNTISTDYFRTLGIPLVAGREFNDRDTAAAPKAVIVNEAFARHYFGDANPIGKRLAFGAGSRITLDREIVGVVKSARQANLREDPDWMVYFPYTQDELLERLTFAVRTTSISVAGDVRALVRGLDAGLPVFDFKPMSARLEESLRTERLIAALSASFGLLAAFLAVVGLYGVIAFTVSRRTPEIGIRVALGASPGEVLRMVLKEVAAVGAAGTAAGLALALVLGRYVESQLYGVRGNDPLVFFASAASLGAVTLLGGYLPALRASRIDPLRALRHE